MNPQEMWQAVLAQMQFHTSPANFATWLKNTFILKHENGVITVSTPNSFSKEWIENKYHKLITKILHGLDEEVKEVRYVVGSQETLNIKTKGHVDSAVSPAIEIQPSFQDISAHKNTGLNPKYKFDNFIVGPFNELAQAAALAVVKNPGHSYNPLFIYGGVGLGKTHLLQAIGNAMLKDGRNNVRVKYVSSDKLVRGVVEGIKTKTMEKFREAYAPSDILIVDDIQFISGKEKCQEEFFHLFNNLYAQNKQIVLSSDHPPKAISSLEDRLRSRFEGGMIADIGYPDLETRIAILKLKAEEKNVRLPEDVVEFIASSFQRNIRELEGALNRLIAFQYINNKTPDLTVTKSLLKNIINVPGRKPNDKKVLKAVADFYELKEDDLLQATRKKEIVQARQVAIYIMREFLGYSYPFIGRKFGGKDHTTIMYACEKIAKNLNKNETLKEDLEEIKQRVYSC